MYRNKNINFDELRDAKIRQDYVAEVSKIIKDENKEHLNPQERWNIITQANKTVVETILGHKERSKKSNNKVVQKLSEEQKDLNNQLNIKKDPTKREEIRKARNAKLNKTHEHLKGQKHQKLMEQIEDTKNSKEDPSRMFKVVKTIANNEKKTPLLVQGKEGLTSELSEQADLIAKHFENTFSEENLRNIREILAKEISPLFTAKEVGKAIKSLKNNKSPGGDEIRAEQLKYGGDETPKEIAKILNEMSKTGECSSEIKEGILTPLQKPGKARGPVEEMEELCSNFP